MTTSAAEYAAIVDVDGGDRWVVDLLDGNKVLFEQGIAAELFAMRFVRERGGGRVLVRHRTRRAPRVIEIPGA